MVSEERENQELDESEEGIPVPKVSNTPFHALFFTNSVFFGICAYINVLIRIYI